MSIPTVIRHAIHPETGEVGIVVTTLGVDKFEARFQIYKVVNDRTVLLATPGGVWESEDCAVIKFKDWLYY